MYFLFLSFVAREHLSRFSCCHAERVAFKQLRRTSQSACLASKDRRRRRRKRNEEQIHQPEVPELLRLLSSLSFSRPQKVTEATRRLESMRAQMGLCLMKFGPSCTCHFRGISDQRPLHRLEHPSRNWRESRSQECLDSYQTTAILSFPFFRSRPIVRAHPRCNCALL